MIGHAHYSDTPLLQLSHASFGSVRPREFWRESSSNKMAAVSGSSPKGRLFTKAPMRDLTKGLVAIMVG